MLAKRYSKVYVLRLGHRPERDKRITTHVGLVARAFGANGFILADICDDKVIESLKKTLKKWGGELHIECGVDGVEYAKKWKEQNGEVIHLTMYGLPVDEIIDEIRLSLKPKLIIVGASKVPPIYFKIADYNVAIGNQPHSEVSALAIFLDRLYEKAELSQTFENAELIIKPSRKGKTVVKQKDKKLQIEVAAKMS